MNSKKFEKEISDIFSVLGNPFRVKLLYAIGKGEACVCHLEAMLKKRQAYISQHLMVLRDAGILDTRRDGKYIFYRVVDKSIFDLIETVAQMFGIPADQIPEVAKPGTHANCACPSCEVEVKTEFLSN
ncbi:MAG: helix-turn-helix transcriptional regulator [Anaerolineales bacterium]|nr:helix-turn-helix transcriptional regulator [Anaerolineales bacterium]